MSQDLTSEERSVDYIDSQDSIFDFVTDDEETDETYSAATDAQYDVQPYSATRNRASVLYRPLIITDSDSSASSGQDDSSSEFSDTTRSLSVSQEKACSEPIYYQGEDERWTSHYSTQNIPMGDTSG